MEAEKFRISRRIIKYKCGCVVDLFDFEGKTPSDKCERHGAEAVCEDKLADEL